jgi:hypothetical protein
MIETIFTELQWENLLETYYFQDQGSRYDDNIKMGLKEDCGCGMLLKWLRIVSDVRQD